MKSTVAISCIGCVKIMDHKFLDINVEITSWSFDNRDETFAGSWQQKGLMSFSFDTDEVKNSRQRNPKGIVFRFIFLVDFEDKVNVFWGLLLVFDSTPHLVR
jgi:hypothetical protein